MAIAQGTVGYIKAFEIPLEQQKPNNFGKVNTHRLSFVLQEQEGVWFNIGAANKDHIDVKFNGNWVTLKKGDKVEFMYQQNGKYNNVKVSAINLTEQAPEAHQQAPAQQSAPQQATTQAPKKSYRKASNGDLVGHAIKCAIGMGKRPDDADFLDTTKAIYNTCAGLKVAYAAVHPELNDYETGAPIGMAMEQLSKNGVTLAEMPEKVKQIIDIQVPLKEYIDAGGEPQTFDWNSIGAQSQSAPVEDNTNFFEDDPDEFGDSFDDSIPF